jgi:hypothetical protein
MIDRSPGPCKGFQEHAYASTPAAGASLIVMTAGSPNWEQATAPTLKEVKNV